MPVSNQEVKKLYGKAGGRCSICEESVFHNDVHIGEMAHIIARKSKGARGEVKYNGDINSYENLILLCANHHTEVDKNPLIYTVEKLHEIKSNHEAKVDSPFGFSKDRKNDVLFLELFFKRVPFTRLRLFVESLPHRVNTRLTEVGTIFNAITVDRPHLYPLKDRELFRLFSNFIDSYYSLWGVVSGHSHDLNGCSSCNFDVPDPNGWIMIRKNNLSFYEYGNLCESLEEKQSTFVKSYYDFMSYVTDQYEEVDVDSYEPIKL
ncbi:MAG: HNH endonuclease [Marinobacterium sp.]|nr:HNH endonuclease [Marinobacterium sp.]